MLGSSLLACGETATDPRTDRPAVPDDDDNAEDGGTEDGRWVRIGIPDEDNTARYTELAEGGDVTIQDGGQGGTHALIALQFQGFGKNVLFDVKIETMDGQDAVRTPALPRPRPVPCDEQEQVCWYSPIFVVLGGLVTPEEWDGLPVNITGNVASETGTSGSTQISAILRR